MMHDALDEYRACRHLVRNLCAFNLRPKKLSDLADGMPVCFTEAYNDVEGFGHFLQSLEESP